MRALLLPMAVASMGVASRALAQDSSAPVRVPAIEPAVETVVSGGTWSATGAHGRYRIVVVAEGWEEVRHRAFVQWVQESESPNGPETVRASVDMTSVAQVYGLAEPVLAKRAGRWHVSLSSAAQPMAAYSRRLSFELGPPGQVRRRTGK